MLSIALCILKTVLVTLFFLIGCFSIVITQLTGMLIAHMINSPDGEFIRAWMAKTKEQFIVLLTRAVIFLSKTPVNVHLTSKDLKQERMVVDQYGKLHMTLSPHGLWMANHQIYTDWLFLWWLNYCAGLGGFVYIILKEELKKVPILGFGMKNYRFIFLSRKWSKDRVTMDKELGEIDAEARGKGPSSGALQDVNGEWPRGENRRLAWPYEMMIYPEGTNLSGNTRGKTEEYARKSGKELFKHILIPRTTGLRFTLLKLKGTVKEIYDLTVGYSGVLPEEYGQDIYQLRNVVLFGKNPQDVYIDIKLIKLDDIPLGKLEYEDPEEEVRDLKRFEDWLFGVWREKDEMMDKFYKTGSFYNKEEVEKDKISYADAVLKTSKLELLKVFTIPGLIGILIRLGYLIYSLYTADPDVCPANL